MASNIEGMAIRNMTRSELDKAVGWAAKEGWNPGLHDADVFWDTDPDGFIALEKNGKMIGSVSMVTYNGEFAFGGFFILLPEFRNKGLGTSFVSEALSMVRKRLSVSH